MPWTHKKYDVELKGSTVQFRRTYRTEVPSLPMVDFNGSHFMWDNPSGDGLLEGWEIHVERTVVQAAASDGSFTTPATFSYDLDDLKEDAQGSQAPYFRISVNTLNLNALEAPQGLVENVTGLLVVSWWLDDIETNSIKEI